MSPESPRFEALISYEDPYVQPLILSAFSSQLPSSSYKLLSSIADHSSLKPLLQILPYETLSFEQALSSSKNLINAYIIRKALIRKHYLSFLVSQWGIKHPKSTLTRHVKAAVAFELDYAEFLDDALDEAEDGELLRESWRKGDGKGDEEREWWILKPGMSDRGQGIRLFSSEEELVEIFKGWEAELSEEEGEDYDGDARPEVQDSLESHTKQPLGQRLHEEVLKQKEYIVTSHLRHFIAQPYIHPPLLLPSKPQKFHIRTYVIALGALKVYVYTPMLALFAGEPYASPLSAASDLRPHLTNTCLQSDGTAASTHPSENVKAFWSLPDVPGLSDWKEKTFEQICSVVAELFRAAALNNSVHFQPLPMAFEIFGVDFLVDADGTAWLLEVNAFPDFRQTGEELRGLVQGLWDEVIGRVVGSFFGVSPQKGRKDEERLVEVLDLDLGRK